MGGNFCCVKNNTEMFFIFKSDVQNARIIPTRKLNINGGLQ